MKRLFVTIGIAVAVVVASAVVYVANDVRNQTNIIKVFSEQSKAANTLREELQLDNGRLPSIRETQRHLQDFAQALQSIDASSCPRDFRLAWFDYVSAVTDLGQQNFTATGVKEAIEVGMSVWTKDGRLAEDAMRDPVGADRVGACFRNCQRIAISYGVRFRPFVNQQQN